MIGTTLSHYKITARLGAGGMGEVYLAQDTKLKRRVALKVLPSEMAENPRRLERFQREAESVAALNHPNIVHIYSVDEADGVHFITMELVEGKSLDSLIPPGGIDLDRFFDIAVLLADALSAAHARGIIHRDLKPANVMVTDADKRVKILDFGLAKLAPFDADDPEASQMATLAMTHEGAVVGTVPYMSPEQLEAMSVDHRTDIFSLGVVLYEMTTGSLPFGGKSAAGLISSILTHKPEPVTRHRAELPRHLGRIVERCLAKDPNDRYQTARDLFNELDGLRREVEAGTAMPTTRGPGEPTLSTAAEPPPPGSATAAGLPRPSAVEESPESAAAPGRTRPRLPPWVIAVVALGGIATGLVTIWVGSGREEDSAANRSSEAAPAIELLPEDAYQATVEGRRLLEHYYREGNVERALRLFEHALELDPDNIVAHAGLAQGYAWMNLRDPDPLWLDRALASASRWL